MNTGLESSENSAGADEFRGFGTYELVVALEQFSRGLWMIFVGTCLMLAAVGCIVAHVYRIIFIPSVIIVTVVLAVSGFIMAISGKQKALSFAAPMSSRKYLRWSYNLDVVAAVTRLVRRAIPANIVIDLITALAGILSLWFLIRFIHHLARLIDAKWARRLTRYCQGALLITFSSAVLLVIALQIPAMSWLAVFLSIMMVTAGFSGTVATILLLATMSFALKSFSQFLKYELVMEDDGL